MNRDEIIQFIEDNQIDKDSSVVFTIIENEQQIGYKGRFEFYVNGTPAITDNRIGLRIQMIKDAPDMPYEGGLLIENLVNVRIND